MVNFFVKVHKVLEAKLFILHKSSNGVNIVTAFFGFLVIKMRPPRRAQKFELLGPSTRSHL